MKTTDLVILGAGGFGREVLSQLKDTCHSYNILGFIDDTPELKGATVSGIPVLGGIDKLKYSIQPFNVVIAIGNSNARKKIYEDIKMNSNLTFPNIIMDGVKISDSVRMGQGCIICYSNILTVDIEIGDFVVINLDCTVGHDAKLLDYVTLYPSVNVSGNVTIGQLTEVGTGVNIIQGKMIGEKTIIGAGSVVIQNLPDNCTAVGAPAKPIKYH